jgi:Protein of unknown function (DUF3592)
LALPGRQGGFSDLLGPAGKNNMFEDEFAKLPVEPPRRLEILPGLRLRGSIPRMAIIFPLFFVAFVVMMPLSIMHADPAMRLAMGPTETAQGRVISNTSSSTCRGGASHHVTYSFSAMSGREYRGGTTLCEASPYYSVNPGDAIEVRYLKAEPVVNALPSERQQEPPPLAFFLFMPVFFLAIFASLFWPPVRELLCARRRFKSGRLAVAKVIFVKKRATGFWPGWLPFNGASEVYVRFTTPNDANREGIASCQNDWLLNQLVPGANVHVAYSEDESAKVAILEAYIR